MIFDPHSKDFNSVIVQQTYFLPFTSSPSLKKAGVVSVILISVSVHGRTFDVVCAEEMVGAGRITTRRFQTKPYCCKSRGCCRSIKLSLRNPACGNAEGEAVVAYCEPSETQVEDPATAGR